MIRAFYSSNMRFSINAGFTAFLVMLEA